MKFKEMSASRGLSFGSVVMLLLWLSTLPARVQAQGQNAVFKDSSNTAASAAFVDATPYTNNGALDICAAIHSILALNQHALVIDARGVTPTISATQCASSPWDSVAQLPWATILLPVGTITTCATWILPQYTRIVGQGPGQGGTIGTTIQAGSQCSPSFTGSAIIQMGGHPSQGGCDKCQGVSVSNLALDGSQSQSNLDGIDNANAEELSYVQHVAMVGIAGVGLNLGSTPAGAPANNGTSSHSGPYSDISITVAGSAAKCVNIFGATDSMGNYLAPEPRGIHGLTCTGSSNPGAAVYLDGHSVSIEDVFISGFSDGILVGSQNTASSNILLNIRGFSTTKLIHICGATTSGNCQNSSVNVSDLSILGATSAANTTIQDDLTLGTPSISDRNVGMYVLGEPVQAAGSNIGYSRFTTVPGVPTWLVGTGNPSLTCAVGDLFSRTSSASGTTLWKCVGPTGTWVPVK